MDKETEKIVAVVVEELAKQKTDEVNTLLWIRRMSVNGEWEDPPKLLSKG